MKADVEDMGSRVKAGVLSKAQMMREMDAVRRERNMLRDAVGEFQRMVCAQSECQDERKS